MNDIPEERSAREILSMLSHKSKFVYTDEMEISVPETDRKNSMDKIAFSFRNEEVVLSDLFIAYAVSLFQFTIPPVIAETIQVFGNLWPDKYIPKNATRDELSNRIKKMCGMGILRRYVFVKDEKNIVLYSATYEINKLIYQLLKYKTDARTEKDILSPVEIVGMAAASLICCELLKSTYLKSFRFMQSFHVEGYGRYTFYAEIQHHCQSSYSNTIVEPFFSKIDMKRYTKLEWQEYLNKKLHVLNLYMDYLELKYFLAFYILCGFFKYIKTDFIN